LEEDLVTVTAAIASNFGVDAVSDWIFIDGAVTNKLVKSQFTGYKLGQTLIPCGTKLPLIKTRCFLSSWIDTLVDAPAVVI
tara:strand:+ start:712 stop:954 length:243 start_codon:yes stop_codon:yes gene_type:complete